MDVAEGARATKLLMGLVVLVKSARGPNDRTTNQPSLVVVGGFSHLRYAKWPYSCPNGN